MKGTFAAMPAHPTSPADTESAAPLPPRSRRRLTGASSRPRRQTASSRPGRQTAGPGLLGRSIAEAAGSFLLVLAGVGVAMLNAQEDIAPSLVFGLALAAAMMAFGHLSGAHFNPAVTLGAAVAGRTRWVNVVPYIIAQLIGAGAAAAILWIILDGHPGLDGTAPIFSNAANGFGEHSPIQFPLTSVLLAEVVAAVLLVAAYLGVTARREHRPLAPFAVGFTYAVLLAVLVPISNGALNPARSTAIALFSESWAMGQLWLFWAAPLFGAAIAGLIYRSVDLSAGERLSDVPGATEAGVTETGATETGATTPAAAAGEDEDRDRDSAGARAGMVAAAGTAAAATTPGGPAGATSAKNPAAAEALGLDTGLSQEPPNEHAEAREFFESPNEFGGPRQG